MARDLDQGRLDQARVVLDELIRWHVVRAAAEHAVDEGVAQILDMLQRLRDVQRQGVVTIDAVGPEMGAAVIVLGDLDHRLGRHAADPGAGGSRLPAIDEDEGFAGPPHLRHGAQAGGAGADDGDVDAALGHGVSFAWAGGMCGYRSSGLWAVGSGRPSGARSAFRGGLAAGGWRLAAGGCYNPPFFNHSASRTREIPWTQ